MPFAQVMEAQEAIRGSRLRNQRKAYRVYINARLETGTPEKNPAFKNRTGSFHCEQATINQQFQ
jgi:hypothetical protein